jgi:hypothetical protein
MKQIGGQQKIECMGTEQTADLAEQSTKHKMEHKEISQASKWQVWALILQHLNFVAVAPVRRIWPTKSIPDQRGKIYMCVYICK